MKFVLPLVIASRAGADFEVISLLRAHCPLLNYERIADQDVPKLIAQLRDDVMSLVEMLQQGSDTTIRQVLIFMDEHSLLNLDDRFFDYLANDETSGDNGEGGTEESAVNRFLDCAVSELWGYHQYIENQSPFATQQGIKGAEFERVLVVLDDEEGDYNLFSYGKYFDITPLSATDLSNIEDGSDSVLGRTRRLFYVCCSRAVRDLTVVLFVPDVAVARMAIEARGLFPPADIYDLTALTGKDEAVVARG